jgi:hypothetical protein
MYTADDLADDVVDQFRDYFYGTGDPVTPLIQFEAVNSAEISEVIVEEQGTYSVFVFPDSETATPFDQGNRCDERLVIGVVVVGPVGTVTKKLAIKFCKQLRRALRGTVFESVDEDEDRGVTYQWLSDEVEPLFDAEALATNSEFVGAFKATYQGLA